ncbi:hypothetical protein H6F93_19585 [Leptolyngbya sp. FACHB-671]|uniref:hypothetical protein n=1 Tax=Leptolyngbya sp. FACHB-671 TaxID=2692812 RepID=UPI0016894B32|nr:hypothetical protein [Leptolyngbya sp. FACHB-671]MBD2069689.1 hypothetical protein [Leptolyngbya sp. FACHB-671]
MTTQSSLLLSLPWTRHNYWCVSGNYDKDQSAIDGSKGFTATDDIINLIKEIKE